jgi:hydrophobic/amphiphilic exporter-1 (mainly G- bacteria), HAE1 family
VATLDKLYLKSPTTGGLVPLATFAKWTTRDTKPLSISHQGQFPAVTISFNLAQGGSLDTATEAIQKAEREMQMPLRPRFGAIWIGSPSSLASNENGGCG